MRHESRSVIIILSNQPALIKRNPESPFVQGDPLCPDLKNDPIFRLVGMKGELEGGEAQVRAVIGRMQLEEMSDFIKLITMILATPLTPTRHNENVLVALNGDPLPVVKSMKLRLEPYKVLLRIFLEIREKSLVTIRTTSSGLKPEMA